MSAKQDSLCGFEALPRQLPLKLVRQDPATLGIPPPRRRGRILAVLADHAPAGLRKGRIAALAAVSPHTMPADLKHLAADNLIHQLEDDSWALKP